MLTQKQIKEIREHLKRAENPVFFFDNDADGLCSFLLLRRYLGRGKGVALKALPELGEGSFRKISEFGADYIFILDKPVISKEFFVKLKEANLPVVWIDHHVLNIKVPDFISYYNPLLNKDKKNEPITYLCYEVTQREDDLWIAVAGCVSDYFIPDFYKEFEKKYPELCFSGKAESAFDIFYRSQIGRMARILNLALKDRTSNVVRMMKLLIDAKNPYDVLEESNANKFIHKRFNEIDRKIKNLSEKAREKALDNVLFFKYSGDLSISSSLANQLSYEFSDKLIVIVYVNGAKANVSVRGENAREIVVNAIESLDEATGGGHEKAAGARINSEDIEKFRKKLLSLLN